MGIVSGVGYAQESNVVGSFSNHFFQIILNSDHMAALAIISNHEVLLS